MNNTNKEKFIRLIFSFVIFICLVLSLAWRQKELAFVKDYVALFVDTLVYVVLAIIGWKFLVKKTIRELATIPDLANIFALIAGVIITFGAIFSVRIILSYFYGYIPTHVDVKLLSVVVVFIASFREEVFFRGFYLGSLFDSFNNIYTPILISSFVFGFSHVNVPITQQLFLSFLGCVLAFGVVKTNSIWFSIGLHFVWNAVVGQAFQSIENVWLPNLLTATLMSVFVIIFFVMKGKVKVKVS